MYTVAITNIISRNTYGIIAACRDEGDRSINVILPTDLSPVVGEIYEVIGAEREFKYKYGRVVPQVTAVSAVRVRTSGRLVRPWLESLPGIGPTRSQRLLSELGADVIHYLGDVTMTKRLAEVLEPDRPTVGERLAALVQMHYFARAAQETTAVLEGKFLLHLESCGVTDRSAAKNLFRLIGSTDSLEQLKQHPYLAAGLLPWKQADHLGLSLLREHSGKRGLKNHPDRLAGACDNVWRDCLKSGDTAMSRQAFCLELQERKVDPAEALSKGIEQRCVCDTGDLLRAPGAAYLESTLAKRIAIFESTPGKGVDLPEDVEALVRRHESRARPLTEEQRRAVCGLIRSKLSLLQGGAGTGKTTTLKVLVDSWIALGGNIMLGAMSGKAALRMSTSTSRLAQTLARHLYKLEQSFGGHNSNMELFPEVNAKTMFIIDEASMVDLVTFRKLLAGMPDGASVVLVGDTGQLPPIGLGQIYVDLVDLGGSVYHLTQVHRQSADNPIITAATAIRGGETPALPKWPQAQGVGVFHLEVPVGEIDTSIITILDQIIPSIPLDDILVLAARRKTCRNINRSMQVRREVDGHTGIRIGPLAPWVSVGEPVICTKNRYQDGLMNGMVGHVFNLDPLTVRWQGEVSAKPVPLDACVDIASAWAITCHRAQGSEARCVIVALDGGEKLTREWLYTAVTRATERVILVGPLTELTVAVTRRSSRTTYFREEVVFWRRQMSSNQGFFQ